MGLIFPLLLDLDRADQLITSGHTITETAAALENYFGQGSS